MTIRELARLYLSDIAACIGFFTRLPLPAAYRPARPFAEALGMAPMAGLAVGLCGAIAFWCAISIGLPPAIAAALALAATMLATGCLHEDGLADVADGFGGGKTRERKLEIMRDSRIGAFGVAALSLSILLRWSALEALATPLRVLMATVAAHMAARALLPAFMRVVKPARSDGLSVGVGGTSQMTVLTAALVGFIGLLMLGLSMAIVTAATLALCFFLLKRLCESQIDGQTGDVLGLLEQAAEIIVLLAACIAFR